MDFMQFLPQDILFNHIINSLDFTTRVRAASVSRLWRDILRAAPCIPDLPWLWFTRQSMIRNDDFESAPTYNSFLMDLASSITIPSCNPPAPSYRFLGSRLPYLTFSNIVEWELTSYLISSPFNRENIQLPCTYVDRDGVRSTMTPSTGMQFSSSRSPNCVIAAWGQRSRENRSSVIYLFKPSDDNWVECLRLQSDRIGDMIFHKDQLYCVEGTDIMAYSIMDIFNYEKKRCNSSHPRSTSPVAQPKGRRIASGTGILKSFYPTLDSGDPGYYLTFLVECGEELLVVVRSGTCVKGKVTFRVHRIDEEKGELVHVEDLGGRMLFVEEGCSVMSGFGPGPTIKTDSFFTENSIYFFHFVPRDEILVDPKQLYRLGKFNLNSSTCYYHPGYGFEDRPLWVVSPHQK